MLRKKPTVFTVIMFGLTVGIAVIVIGYFAIYFQRHNALESSKKGSFPKMIELTDVRKYDSDDDGDYFYSIDNSHKKISEQSIMVWSRLVYSINGRDRYIQKRKYNGLFVEGLENLAQRNTLYEFKCAQDKAEYAVAAVFEIGKDGRTLDYGSTGKDREWGYTLPGSSLEKLSVILCSKTK